MIMQEWISSIFQLYQILVKKSTRNQKIQCWGWNEQGNVYQSNYQNARKGERQKAVYNISVYPQTSAGQA